MSNFINYDNNIEVLNEGFFDFVKKWTARIFHSLFKANDFEDLYKRVAELEDIIKYGKVEEVKESVNEGIRSRRSRHIIEAEGENDSSVESENKSEKRVTAKEVDLATKSKNVKVDMKSVNMKPSFPQVAKQLLTNLEKQINQLKGNLSDKKIKKDIDAVKSGQPLSQRYVNTIEIIVTDFLRKYSSGTLTLPKPERNQTLSYEQLNQWQQYANQPSRNSDKMFAYVHDAMEKIVNDYESQFKTNFENLKTSEDSFIQKYKNGEKSKDDLQFITNWENKITQKMSDIKSSCIEFIPTAISNYFINDKIYKTATDYVLLCLELLVINSKNVANKSEGKGNSLINYMNEWLDGDKEDIINIVNKKCDEILNKINNNKNYSALLNELKSINENTINNAISNIQNIKNIQKYSDNRLSLITNDAISKAVNNDPSQGIVIAILLNSIDQKYIYKIDDIENIFNINV